MGFFDKIRNNIREGDTLSPSTNISRRIQQSGQQDLRDLRDLANRSTDFRTGAQKQSMQDEMFKAYDRLAQTGIGGGMTGEDRRQSFERSRQAFGGQAALAIDPRSPGAAFQQRRQQMRSQAAAADIARNTVGADIAMRKQFDAENLALANMFTRLQTTTDQRLMQAMLDREKELMALADRQAARREGQTQALTSILGTALGGAFGNFGK